MSRLWRRWGWAWCLWWMVWGTFWGLSTLLTHGPAWASAVHIGSVGWNGGLLLAWANSRLADQWEERFENERRIRMIVVAHLIEHRDG